MFVLTEMKVRRFLGVDSLSSSSCGQIAFYWLMVLNVGSYPLQERPVGFLNVSVSHSTHSSLRESGRRREVWQEKWRAWKFTREQEAINSTFSRMNLGWGPGFDSLTQGWLAQILLWRGIQIRPSQGAEENGVNFCKCCWIGLANYTGYACI